MQSSTAETDDDVSANPRSPGSLADPQLVLVLEADRPLAGGARFSLAGVHEIVVGRGPERTAKRETRDGLTRLTVSVPARSLSQRHARVVRSAEQWILEDTGSRNGSFMDGQLIQRAAWSERSIVQLGHVFFVIRNSCAGAPRTLDARDLVHEPPGIRTLASVRALELEGLRRVAGARLPILLLGETGTGKDLVARGIHALAERKGAFVPVSCGALADVLLVDREASSRKNGAAQSAKSDVLGMLRAAERGTLFLDEVAELPESAQSALLRILEEAELLSSNGTRIAKNDLLIVSSTRKPLGSSMTPALPRQELLARLAGHVVTLPPLRDRLEDLGLILSDILRSADPERAERIRLTPSAATALFTYAWPLNVRELKHAILAGIVLSDDGVIHLSHLPAVVVQSAFDPGATTEPVRRAAPMTDEELRLRAAILATLREHKGNVAAVARAMRKAPMQVHRWMKRFEIDAADFRRANRKPRV